MEKTVVKNKLIKNFSLLLVSLLLCLSLPNQVQAQTSAWGEACQREGVATIQGIQCIVANVLSVVLTAIGLLGFLMLVVGAFRYLLSGGNLQATEKAQKTLTYAVIGLVVALSAFIILNLIAEFTGVKTITDFIIPGSDTKWAELISQ